MVLCSEESIGSPPLLLIRHAQHAANESHALFCRLNFVTLARNTLNAPGTLVACLLQNMHRPGNIHCSLVALCVKCVCLEVGGACIAGALRPARLTQFIRPVAGVEQQSKSRYGFQNPHNVLWNARGAPVILDDHLDSLFTCSLDQIVVACDDDLQHILWQFEWATRVNSNLLCA